MSRLAGKVCLLLVLVLALSTTARAEDGVKITPDIVYGHKDGMALTFDQFQPSNPNGAAVLYMVSGGWVSTWSPPAQAVNRFKPLLDKGFTIFAVRHGSSPRYKVPEAVADVRLATRYIHLHEKDLKVDANRLGVHGGSAGGHLSLVLGCASDNGDTNAKDDLGKTTDRVACVVAYFPPVDLRRMTGPNDRFPALDFDNALAEGISPLVFVSKDDPPTLLVHGDADTLVNISNSQSIYAAFKKEGVESEFVTLPGAGHGFRGADSEKANGLMVDWFVKHLAAKK